MKIPHPIPDYICARERIAEEFNHRLWWRAVARFGLVIALTAALVVLLPRATHACGDWQTETVVIAPPIAM